MRYVTEITGSEPVTMQFIKEHLRVNFDDEDGIIYAFVSAAREHAEKITSQAIVPQTIKAYYDAPPYAEGYLDLPLSNAVAITTVKYLDGTGTQQTLSSGEYYLTVGQPNRVYFINGVPGATKRMDSVEIVYTAGLGLSPYKPVSQTIKAAIAILAADLFEHRESQSTQKLEQNMTFERLLTQNREFGL